MTSEINKLKHFHVENYSGTNFTDDLNDGEEFLYTTIRCKDDKEVTLLCKYVKNKHIGNCPNCIFNKYLCYGGFVGNLGLVKKLWKKYTEAIYKYRTNTGKMTASNYTHLFGYLNPYYRSAYNIPKRRK
nr:MAG: hypothetical protein [Bacteriophage sp.]